MKPIRSLSLLLALFAAPPLAWSAAEVNVYSARQESLIRPLLDQFTKATGIRVNLVSGDADALLQRLSSEGRNSPADMLLTTDAGRLHRAKAAGVLRAVDSPIVNGAVPTQYRDPEGFWFGLSLRARPIFYSPERVQASELSSYEALADEKWRGRICIRSSNNIYNQSLVASMLSSTGNAETARWLNGLVRNFARPPAGGDRDQIKAAAAGVCDIAIANTYYFAQMQTGDDPEQRAASAKIAIFWPNQHGRGTHVNVSGAGITQFAPNAESALTLLEFMVSTSAQQWYADTNYEYPVLPGVKPSALLGAWGEFHADDLNLGELGARNAEAVMLMDAAGWR